MKKDKPGDDPDTRRAVTPETIQKEKERQRAIAASPKHENMTPVVCKTPYGTFTAYFSHDAEKRSEALIRHYEKVNKKLYKPEARGCIKKKVA